MIRQNGFFSGVVMVAGIGLLTGCGTAPQVENTYIGDSKESIYRTVEKSQTVYRNEQAELVNLFDHAKDRTGFKGNMMHLVLKPGTELKPSPAKNPEIIYAAKGTGMAKLNGVAYILQEGTGLYIPQGSSLELLNNSKAELKIMVICHDVPELKWAATEKPLEFKTGKETIETMTADKKAGKDNTNALLNKEDAELIPNVPGTFTKPQIQPQVLTPKEQKVNTLVEEGFVK